MGLLDSVLGGTPDRSGLSAATKALLLVLAAKAAKDYMAHRQAGAPAAGGGAGGGLGGLVDSVLGGVRGAASGAQGGAQSGGLGGLGGLLGGLGGAGALSGLVDQFTKGGHGDAVRSWIGPGANQPIAPAELGQVLSPDTLQELQAKTGLSRDDLLSRLAHELPAAMDHITPEGRLPTDQELTATA